ncbi:MAG: hypothetical protein HOZ81_50440 [Streptomyces sp.]|nr:hypothetical protein [Streptomyces sp.]NUS24394.1 hypothetical protein [Streptomyces sp.]
MQPTDHHKVLARAAQILEHNGIFHGDFIPDPFNRRMTIPDHLRPMSVRAALNCAVTGDPRLPSNASWAALRVLARTVLVKNEPAWSDSIEDAERHVDRWSDSVPAEYAVHMLRLLSGRALGVAA